MGNLLWWRCFLLEDSLHNGAMGAVVIGIFSNSLTGRLDGSDELISAKIQRILSTLAPLLALPMEYRVPYPNVTYTHNSKPRIACPLSQRTAQPHNPSPSPNPEYANTTIVALLVWGAEPFRRRRSDSLVNRDGRRPGRPFLQATRLPTLPFRSHLDRPWRSAL